MLEKGEVTIQELMQMILTNDKHYDLSKIQTAYEFAAKAHEGQRRSSGQPYIIHPLAVAKILLELGMDTDTICAALLHDVVEDTDATSEDLQKRFGRDVAMLVEGVTKLTNIPIFNKEQQQAENVRKIMLAMSQDIRVIIIKLCDRLHNMRTLCFRPAEKQRNTARETMDIYVPIANRLGIRKVKEELEDISFQYLDPYAYQEIEGLMEGKKEEREQFIENIKSTIAEELKKHTFKQTPEIEGRVKSIYGIYKKMYLYHKDFDQIYDKYAVRIIVSDVSDCYAVLGLMHYIFRPLPNRIKDYISNPKKNNYQSLHTTVLGREGIPFEIQIRSWEMHATAEYGIAAHWKYKEGLKGKDKMDQKLSWIRKILEAQQTADDVEEIVRIIKSDLAPEDMIVMTPKGAGISMPIYSTVIDFAYRIHTEIGHKMIGARIDGKIVPLDTELKNGQICEILTSKDPAKGPNRAWLEIAKTNEAKSKIRSWFKHECRDENIVTGKTMLEKAFRRNHITIPEEDMEKFFSEDMKRHSCTTMEDFYASIGYGGIILSKLMPRIKEQYLINYQFASEQKELPIVVPAMSGNFISLDDIQDCEIKMAQCCNPLRGDDIIGFVTRGHGLSVHTKNCVNFRAVLTRNIPEELERWLEVKWTNSAEEVQTTSLEVIATDRVGLVFDITAVLSEARIPIIHSSSRVLKNGNAYFEAAIKILNKSQFNAICDRIKKIKGVISVDRVNA